MYRFYHSFIPIHLFFCVSCSSSIFDPNTHEIALTVAELTSVYVLRAGDFWAELEKSDGDEEWKDIVADVYIALRKAYKFNYGQEKLIDKQVTETLQLIKKHKEGIQNGSSNNKEKVL